MGKIQELFLIIVISSASLFSQNEPAGNYKMNNSQSFDNADWRSLFNGKDLDGWSVRALPADQGKNFWSVENGAIICNSMSDSTHNYVWLQYDNEFDNFELRLKFQAYKESPGNSGVQVRSRYNENKLAAGGYWLDGPQIDIDPSTQWRTGLIYDETWEERRWICPSLKNSAIDRTYAPENVIFHFENNKDAWNDLLIVCKGNTIKTFLNNNPVVEYDGEGILNNQSHLNRNVGQKGYIALQLHTKSRLKMRYKDLFIREIR